MHASCILFAERVIKKEEVFGKSVLEVGSLNVNGSIKDSILMFKPQVYTGIDMRDGLNVDLVCNSSDLIKTFGEESFDVVLCFNTLEHIEDWKTAIHNIKGVCKKDGIILITTVSKGFQKHDYPNDYWRYELDDMKAIFSDCEIRQEKDPEIPGVFLKARKIGIENDLSDIVINCV